MHDNASGASTNYMWHEAIAGRGANEIASCLYDHILKMPNTVHEIVYYSDSCQGQNKNSHVIAMFLKAISEVEHLTKIDHKLLEVGHTHMECDVDHSLIEKKKKSRDIPIYHPHDWYQLVRSTGKKQQFVVHEMAQKQFFDFAGTLKSKLIYRKKNKNGEIFKLHDVKWFQYNKNESGTFRYKHTLDEDVPFSSCSFIRNKKWSLQDVQLEERYKQECFISKEKKNDLLDLLPLIPPVFHAFYKNLKTEDTETIDPDLEEFVED